MPRITARVPIQLKRVLPETRLVGSIQQEIVGVCSVASECQPGDAFVALAADHERMRRDVKVATMLGAALIVTDQLLPDEIAQCVVNDAREAFGKITHAILDYPSQRLTTVGVTGYRGKTSICHLTSGVLKTPKKHVAISTTLARSSGQRMEWPADREEAASAAILGPLLADAVDAKSAYGLVEFSARSLRTPIATGLELDFALIAGVGSESMERYSSIRDFLKPSGALVANLDDPKIASWLVSQSTPTLTYGFHPEADVRAVALECYLGGQVFLLCAGNEAIPVRTSFLGDHYVRHCLAAATIGFLQGMSLESIARGIESVSYIPGRMQSVGVGQEFAVVVDEARTLEGLNLAIKGMRKASQGRLICVAAAQEGCEPRERAAMGRLLERATDLPILTRETYCPEGPWDELHDVLDGFDRVAKAHPYPNRASAIRHAIQCAQPGDAILIAGMGHRAFATAAGQSGWTDDVEEATVALAAQLETDKEPRLLPFPGVSRTTIEEAGDSSTSDLRDVA